MPFPWTALALTVVFAEPGPVSATPDTSDTSATPGAPDAQQAPAEPVVSDEDLFALEDEMVTAASRIAEPLREAPASITLVTDRELRGFGYRSVADALTGVRGLYQTDDLFYTSLGIRGFSRFGDYGNRLQVQLDGHTMNDDWIFSSYIANDFATDIDHVEGIEVVRGPGSALYGSGALFGVVNVRTPSMLPPYHARFGGGVVDSQTWRLHADGGEQIEGGPSVYVAAAASMLPPRDYQSDAYVGTPWAPDGVAHGVDAFSTQSAFAKAWWGDVTLETSWHRRMRTIPTGHFGVVFGDVRNDADDRRGFVELRFEPAVGPGLQLLTRAWVDTQEFIGRYTDIDPSYSLQTEHYSSTWGGAEVRLVARFFDDTLRATLGVEGETHPFTRWLYVDAPGLAPSQDETVMMNNGALYALADWSPWPWLLVSAGARLDGAVVSPGGQYGGVPLDASPPGLFASVNPRGAVVWMPTAADTFKAMFGRASRVPSIYELTYSPVGIDFKDGNPIEPEGLSTAELEYRRRLPADVLGILSVYANWVETLVEYLGASDRQLSDGYANTDDPLIGTGIEAELRRDLGDGFIAAASYAYQVTRIGEVFTGEPVPNSPAHLFAARLLAPLAGERLSLANRISVEVGRRDRNLDIVEPTLLWDATLVGHFSELPADVTVGVNNVLGLHGEVPVTDRVADVRLPIPGRTFHAEVLFHF